MRYRKTRRFRHRPNGRNHQNRINGGDQMRHRPSSFSTERTRNNINLPHNAEKLVERYNSLAKEALSSGDKILAENYFQFADHFIRIVDERRLNQTQNTGQVNSNKKINNESLTSNSEVNQNPPAIEKKE